MPWEANLGIFIREMDVIILEGLDWGTFFNGSPTDVDYLYGRTTP